jgi:hypothetical protein
MTNRLTTENLGQLGACRVVDQHTMESYTSMGWALVAILQEDGYDTVGGNYNNQTGQTEYEYPAVTHTKFLIRQPEDETLQSMEHRIKQAERESDEARRKASTAKEDAEEATKAQEGLQAEVERLSAVEVRQNEHIRELRQEVRDTNAAGQTDRESLAKIKSAIGAINFQEILDGKVD